MKRAISVACVLLGACGGSPRPGEAPASSSSSGAERITTAEGPMPQAELTAAAPAAAGLDEGYSMPGDGLASLEAQFEEALSGQPNCAAASERMIGICELSARICERASRYEGGELLVQCRTAEDTCDDARRRFGERCSSR
jgi:hypothetical protein